MSTADRADEDAKAGFTRRYLPAGITTWESDVSSSTSFGPFDVGDWVVIIVTGATHVNAAATGGAAIATNPQLPAGIHDFTVPPVDGVDPGAIYVHLLAASSGAGVAYKVS